MTTDNGKSGMWSKVNWQSLIQAGVATVIIGGGGLLSVDSVKKDMIACESRLTSTQLESKRDLNKRLDIFEERTIKLLTLYEANDKDVEWIKSEIRYLRDRR